MYTSSFSWSVRLITPFVEFLSSAHISHATASFAAASGVAATSESAFAFSHTFRAATAAASLSSFSIVVMVIIVSSLLIIAVKYIIASETRLNISHVLKICKRSRMEKVRKLTYKQEMFARAYVKNQGNGPSAYAEAGYSVENMNEDSIRKEASVVRNSPLVAPRIDILQEDVRFRLGIDEDSLLGIAKDLIRDAQNDDRKGERRTAVAALNELNKMLGGHKAPQASSEDAPIHKVQLVGMPDNGHVHKEENK